MRLQTMLQAVFPPECLSCSARLEDAFALCGPCWSETPFIFGAACDLCGTGLPGQLGAEGEDLICGECQRVPRAWDKARAVFGYESVGRKLVLSLKHGDRSDIARAAGPWMARAAADLLEGAPVLVPVPLHWTRLAKRRFNQSALLAWSLARETGAEVAPQALLRLRPTPSQEGRSRDARYANVDEAIIPHPRKSAALAGRNVVVIDDVMTSGATLAIATEACRRAGAKNVSVLALARVGDDT